MNNTILLTALVSASAFAQEVTPPPPPPPAPLTATPADAPLVDEEDPGGRVRWGVSGNLGWHIPQSAFTFGAEGRIGYQLSNMFSAYAVVGGTVGLGFALNANIEGANVGVTALSYYYFGAIAEVMLADLFYVGGGPVLASGAFVGASGAGNSGGVAEVRTTVAAGLKPALDLRLGLGLGRTRPAPSYRRGGFNLGLDALILFHPNAVTTTLRADGPNGSAGASIVTNGLAVSVVPMLMLGYDAR